ncbi:unnamed protein product [Schistosoma spindalis]|nr:unnamed protein product [Schistosoma spindale]
MTDDELFGQFVFPNGDYYEGQYAIRDSGIVRHGKGKFIGNFRKRLLDVAKSNSISQSYENLSDINPECKNRDTFDVSMLCDLFGETFFYKGYYSGEWVNDKIEGFGKVKFTSGSHYEGSFKDNKMDGLGIYYWPSGHILKAQFEQNNIQENSLIELIDPDGKQWTGRFKRNHQQKLTFNENDKCLNETQMNFEVDSNYLNELPFSESLFADFEVFNKELKENNQLFDYIIKEDELPCTIQTEQLKDKENLKIIKGKRHIQLLDMILNSKLKEEKEVKENTRILQKQIEDELNDIINSNKKFKTSKQISHIENTKQNSNQIVLVDTFEKFNTFSDEICRNIEKFLQLNDKSLSQNHNTVKNKSNDDSHENNVKPNDLDEEITSNSIFKTEYIKERQTNEEKEKEDRINKLLDQEIEVNSRASLQGNHCNQFTKQNTSFNESLFNSFNGKSKQNNKNFIKRNIELASHWKDIIPMTIEDKERLEEILAEEEEEMQIIKQNDILQNELNINIHKESCDSNHNDRLLSIDNMRSILRLYLNRTKKSGSSLDEPVSNNDDDQNSPNNQSNSVNQLMLKENCQQLDNQLLRMLCRLNEIDEQLEKFQIQRKIDNENPSEILSSLRSTEEENKILNEPIRPGEYALSKYQETREVKERLNEIETRLAQIQKTSFEELNAILFLICYTKLWRNSSNNIEQLTIDLNELTPND